MTTSLSPNSVQNSFNSLLKSYPAVEHFCNEVYERALTRNIIANEMEKLQKSRNKEKVETDTKTLRSIAKKFKKIVVAVDDAEERGAVSSKVNALIERIMARKMPKTPFIKQVVPFLKKLKRK
ncbi:MAG: hypothetical protein ACK5JU_03660, partial [Bacteroidales bacterium]